MSTSRRAPPPPISRTSTSTNSRMASQYTPPSYSSSQAYNHSPLSQSHHSPSEGGQSPKPSNHNESHAYSHHHHHHSRFSIVPIIPSSSLSTKSLNLRDNLRRDMRDMNGITNLKKYRQRRRLFKLASILFFSCLTLWSLFHYFFFHHGGSSTVSPFFYSFSSGSSKKEGGGNFNPSDLGEEEEVVDYEAIASSSRTKSSSPRGGGSVRRKLTDEILLNNLSLDGETCRATFPGLMKEIDDTVAKGPFKVKRSSDLGPMQVRIREGRIYVLHAQRKRDLSREMVNVCFVFFPFPFSSSVPFPPFDTD